MKKDISINLHIESDLNSKMLLQFLLSDNKL